MWRGQNRLLICKSVSFYSNDEVGSEMIHLMDGPKYEQEQEASTNQNCASIHKNIRNYSGHKAVWTALHMNLQETENKTLKPSPMTALADITYFKPIIINNQQDATILIYLFLISSTCSDDVFIHHQELINVTTVSGNAHRCCCWLVLCIRNTSQQQHRWTIPEAVVQRSEIKWSERSIVKWSAV